MERTFIGKVLLWYIIFEEPGLIAATTEDKLDIDGVEEGAPALQTGESIHEGTLLHVPPQLGDNLHRVLVPSAKSVHNQRNENDSLCLTSFTVFSHFDIEGMLDSVFFLTGDLSSKLLLKGSILAQRESRTSAGRSSLPGRSPAGSFRGPRAS